MTLVLAFVNTSQAVQLSDRRLTSEGALVDPESDKAITLTCADARAAIGYTGLARAAGWRTHDELLDVVTKAGPPEHGIGPMTERMTKALTAKFSRRSVLKRVPPEKKRVTVMLTGYRYDHDPPLAFNVLITNYQDWDSGLDSPTPWAEFRLTPFTERRPLKHPMTLIQRVGAYRAVNHTELERMRPMLERRVDPRRLIAKGIAIVRDAAGRSPSIGMDVSSIVVPREPSADPYAEYHPATAEHKVILPSQVVSLPELAIAMKDIRIEAVDPRQPRP